MKKRWFCMLLVLLGVLTSCAAPQLQSTFDAAREPQPTCGPDGPPWILHNTEGVLNAIRQYDGQVDSHRISCYLTGYSRKEALRFLRSLEFETLSEGN